MTTSERLTPEGCAQHMLQAHQAGALIDPGLARPTNWAMAVEILLQQGHEDAVRHALPALAKRFQRAFFANQHRRLIDKVQAAEGAGADGDRHEGARRLRAAFKDRTPLDLRGVRAGVWTTAVEDELTRGRFDELKQCLPALVEAFPGSPYFQTVLSMLDSLPPPSDPPFKDDPRANVQIVRHEGADTVLLAFTGGMNRQLGLPASAVHRWLAPLGVHIVYLREAAPTFFLRGAPGLGHDQASTLEALRGIVADLGAARILTLGSSGGGYPALRFGLDLGAEAVLAFGATTWIPESSRGFILGRIADRVATTAEEMDSIDMRPRLLAAARPPRIRLVHGARDKRDEKQAQHLADLPGVSIETVPGGHNAVLGAVLAGRFGGLLADLVGR